MEVKDVLENYTNLEKECESAKQPVSVELQVLQYFVVFIIIIIMANMVFHMYGITRAIGEAEETQGGLAIRKVLRRKSGNSDRNRDSSQR